MPARITRDDEGINLYFTDYANYETSGDFAYDFIVDYTPDDRAIGLEILWNERERVGMEEEPVVAFGVFGTALAELGLRYYEDVTAKEADVVTALSRRIAQLIEQAGLDLHISAETTINTHGLKRTLDVLISNTGGKPLLCAEVKRRPFQYAAVEQCHHYLKMLATSGAIGVCVFIDDTGQGHRNSPVEPGRWIDWPEANLPGGGHVWAHIAIIPPVGCEYPWLPKTFLPSHYEVEASA